jgi:eukaryotic-like serine/threonine-protein kinase
VPPTPEDHRDHVLDRPTVVGARLGPGQMLGRYCVEELIGRGGMGEVWTATDDNRRCRVVVKILPMTSGDDPDEVARVKDSFRCVSKL